MTSTDAAAPQEKRSLLRGTQLTEMLYATMWLVFLVVPLGAALGGDAAWGWKLLALAATAAFGVIYCWQMGRWILHAGLVPLSDARLVRMVVLLSVTAAFAIPAAGSWSVAYLTYISAMIIFTTRLLPGIAAGLALWAVPTALTFLLVDRQPWVIIGPGIGMVFIVITRITEHHDERARWAEQQLRAAEDRDRIARDVHDVLGHSLTVLSIKAQLVRRTVDQDPQRAAEEAEDMERISREALAQVRTTVTALKAPELPGEIEVARSALQAAGITPVVSVSATPGSGPELLAWALREAVTNVLRHSHATRCVIELSEDRLVVTDDGVGRGGSAEGNGLQGLRRRAATVGASVTIGHAGTAHGEHPEQQLGTRIQVQL